MQFLYISTAANNDSLDLVLRGPSDS